MSGNCEGGLLLAEGQFLFGINPLLEYDLAVFAFGNVHGVRTLFEFVRHFLAHVNADGFGVFADWIRRHNELPPLCSGCVLPDWAALYNDPLRLRRFWCREGDFYYRTVE